MLGLFNLLNSLLICHLFLFLEALIYRWFDPFGPDAMRNSTLYIYYSIYYSDAQELQWIFIPNLAVGAPTSIKN